MCYGESYLLSQSSYIVLLGLALLRGLRLVVRFLLFLLPKMFQVAWYLSTIFIHPILSILSRNLWNAYEQALAVEDEAARGTTYVNGILICFNKIS